MGSPTPLVNIKNATFTGYMVNNVRNFLISDEDVNASGRTHLFTVATSGTMYDEDIELPAGKNRGMLCSVLGTKDKMFVFRSLYSKKEKKNILYAHSVTLQIQVDPEGVELTSIAGEKPGNSGDFGINVSPGGNRVVVFGQYPPVKNMNEKFSISVFDAGMKKLWSKEFVFDNLSEKEPFNDVFISDNGTVCIIKRMGPENFTAFVIKDEKDAISEYSLNLGAGKKVMNFGVAFNEQDEPVISGFYTTSADVKLNPSFNGAYIFVIENDGRKSSGSFAFDSPLKDLDVRYILPQPDGNVLLAAEEFVRESTGLGEGQEGGERIQYRSGKVHLLMMDASGKKIWNTSIPKEARSVDDGGLFQRFGLYTVNERFYVFFNDEQSRYSPSKGKVPCMVPVKKDGTKEKHVILMNRRVGGEGEIFLLPSVGVAEKSTVMFMGVSEESFFPLTLSLSN